MAGFFTLESGTDVRAAFADLAIVSEIKPVDLTEGTGDTVLLGQRIRPVIRLQRRHDSDLSLFVWHKLVVSGSIPAACRNCTITAFDAEGRRLARYELDQAWPSRIDVGPIADSPSGELLETVTLICDDVRRVTL